MLHLQVIRKKVGGKKKREGENKEAPSCPSLTGSVVLLRAPAAQLIVAMAGEREVRWGLEGLKGKGNKRTPEAVSLFPSPCLFQVLTYCSLALRISQSIGSFFFLQQIGSRILALF